MENKKDNFRGELDIYLSELNKKINDLQFRCDVLEGKNKELESLVLNLVSVISTKAPDNVKAAALESINKTQNYKNQEAKFDEVKDLPGNFMI